MFLTFYKPPPKEPTPVAGEPPLQWAEVHALMDWLARPEAPACAHTHKDTIHFLLDHTLPVDLMLRWLRAHGGHCDCTVLIAIGIKCPHHVG